MATKKKAERPSVTSWRPTSEDHDMLDALRAKLGVAPSQIIRIGLRRLAESEGLKLRKVS